LSRDPIEEEGGLNIHSFVRNRGVCTIDKLGLDPINITIMTFIEWPTVTDPFGWVFEGDNHGPGEANDIIGDWDFPSYRTLHRVTVDPCKSNPIISSYTDCGVSRRLDPNTGEVITQAKSSGSTMKIKMWESACKLWITMSGDESNPLHNHGPVSAPGISYQLSLAFDRCGKGDGNVFALLQHDGFPSYDIYFNYSLWYSWSHVLKGTTPTALFPPMEISSQLKNSYGGCCH
jgi:hypothetical protein